MFIVLKMELYHYYAVSHFDNLFLTMQAITLHSRRSTEHSERHCPPLAFKIFKSSKMKNGLAQIFSVELLFFLRVGPS